jgi:Ni/Co efflux regulator RcnB
MKTFLIALLAFGVLAAPMAEAGNNKRKPKPHITKVERNHGGYRPNKHVRPNREYSNRWNGNRNRRGNGNINGNNNRWNGGHNNYYYDNRRNYNNNNGGGNFYNDPYFWGGVAGGLIGGAIIGNQYYDEPICRYVWTQVYIPGYGYQSREVEVCD